MLNDTVKTALRLGSAAATALSTEIDRNIKTARAELIRAGVSIDVAESSNALVENAIVTYCLMNLGNQNLYDKYQQSWEYQLDNLRKSSLEVVKDVQ